MNSGSQQTDARWARIAGVGLLIAAVLTLAVAWRFPAPSGMWEDDGVYLATARAIADGHGYRHVELPGEPWQTKYPVAYPLLLAGLRRVWTDFPANLFGVAVLNVVLATAAGWITFRLLQRGVGAPAWCAALAVLTWAFNGRWFEIQRLAMSEPLFALLCVSALYYVTVRRAAPLVGSREILRGLAIGALVGGAYLTRSIGAVLILACVLSLILQRRWLAMLAMLGVAGVAVGGWQIWLDSARAANSAISSAGGLAYDLDYRVWAPTGGGDLAWVVQNNLAEFCFSIPGTLLQLPVSLILSILRAGDGGGIALTIVGAALTLLISFGAVRFSRQNGAAIAIFAGIYLIGVACWPFPTWRFLAPIIPFLAAFAMSGAYGLAAPLLARLTDASTADEGSDAVGTAAREPATNAQVAWLLSIVFTLLPAWGLIQNAQSFLRPDHRDFAERLNCAADAIRGNTPPDAVVACGGGGGLYLHTGRKTIPLVPAVRPIASYYPADRRPTNGGFGTTRGTAAEYERMLHEDLGDYLRKVGATHAFVPNASGPLGKALAERIQSDPAFSPLTETPRGVLYSIRK